MAKHIGEGVNITADANVQWDNGAAGSAALTYNTTDTEFQFDTNVEVQGNLNVTGNISGNITDVDFGDITVDSIVVDTGDAKIYAGSDLILYSDAGSTVKCTIDGATGNIDTSGSVEADGDITITDATKGLVLKDTQATPHNWRITINNDGTLQTTDLGAA